MVHAFVSAEARRIGRPALRGLTTSLLAHTALIVAALIGTAASSDVVAARPAAPNERLVFVSREKLDRSRATARAAAKRHRAAQRTDDDRTASDVAAFHLPSLVDLTIPDVVVDVPTVELGRQTSSDLDFVGSSGRDLLRVSTGHDRAVYVPGRLYTEDMVEASAEARSGNPTPRYPMSLQRDGVEDTFIVYFVVDTAGHVEEGTLRFPKRTHRLLIASVRAALLRSRYFPAEVAGHHVAQVVKQQFSFIIARP